MRIIGGLLALLFVIAAGCSERVDTAPTASPAANKTTDYSYGTAVVTLEGDGYIRLYKEHDWSDIIPGFISAQGPNNYATLNAGLCSVSYGVVVGDKQVIGPQQPAIPDATDSTLVATVNALLTICRAHGLIAK